jgi:hypothetical protein
MATAVTLTVNIPTGREKDLGTVLDRLVVPMTNIPVAQGFDVTLDVVPELDDPEEG